MFYWNVKSERKTKATKKCKSSKGNDVEFIDCLWKMINYCFGTMKIKVNFDIRLKKSHEYAKWKL